MTNIDTRILLNKMHLEPEDEDLVRQFFVVFSRFEYALKQAGYLKKRNRLADPDWTCFAHATTQYYESAKIENRIFEEATSYIRSNRPEVEIKTTRNSRIIPDFCDEPPRATTEWGQVVEYVKRVRNNLFHGGKYPSGPISDPARNPQLLWYSLVILETCLEWDTEVKYLFEAPT